MRPSVPMSRDTPCPSSNAENLEGEAALPSIETRRSGVLVDVYSLNYLDCVFL